jgi:hypothetical protein
MDVPVALWQLRTRRTISLSPPTPPPPACRPASPPAWPLPRATVCRARLEYTSPQACYPTPRATGSVPDPLGRAAAGVAGALHARGAVRGGRGAERGGSGRGQPGTGPAESASERLNAWLWRGRRRRGRSWVAARGGDSTLQHNRHVSPQQTPDPPKQPGASLKRSPPQAAMGGQQDAVQPYHLLLTPRFPQRTSCPCPPSCESDSDLIQRR